METSDDIKSCKQKAYPHMDFVCGRPITFVIMA